MNLPSLRAFAMFTAPVLVGGAAGHALLDQMNRAHPALTEALRRTASPITPSATPSGHLVVVVVDGVGDAFFERNTRDGTLRPVTWSQPLDSGAPSLSRPSYHALFTGVAQDVAGVHNNRHKGPARADTAMDRVRAAGGTVAWALETVDWMYDLAGASGERYLHGDEALDVDAIAALASRRSLVVVHWTRTDDAGHHHGARSERYAREVRASLARASRLHDALSAAMGPEGFTLLVGADHGHMPQGGHGGPEPDVTHTRWVRLGGASVPASALARRPETVMAATFTDALGVDSPRQTTGCPLPVTALPSRADCGAITRRREALRGTLEGVRAAAHRRSRALLASLVTVITAAVTFPGRSIVRSRTIRALAALGAVLAGALAGYALLGPGWTLSAIRTEASFVARATLSMALGAGGLWALVRRVTAARASDVALATSLVPLAAVAYTLGASGRSPLGDVATLVAPAAGLFPAAACAAIGLSLARR